ncbi:hypothetical protein A0H81_05624 [Grifola frondosa]|uniref:Uncharacterized protein n=1 Tax=Grifola frondosa TaxID=5627 RepID=A0A1C7MD67_GRIFR|nr:hypothetical protein A0H81_05624 [Grifola frondosa]
MGEVAPSLGLPETFVAVKFKKFSPPMCLLPPSLHRGLYEGGWRMMDVYQERSFQEREACRVKLLEPWLEPVLALFEGRVIDTPKSAMPSTHFSATFSATSAVEHKIFIIGGILFLVVELKFTLDIDDNFVQLFPELLSAARTNKSANFANLRVFGLLTDVSSFRFYSYDPLLNEFHSDENILVNAKRDDFCCDMIQVSNKIFSVTMYAYMEVLRGTVQSSQRRSENGDLSPTGSSPIQQLTKTPSVSRTKRGLEFAEEAYKKLQEVSTDAEQLEHIATDGLGLLARSVHCLPRFSDSSSEKNPSTAKELRAVAEGK